MHPTGESASVLSPIRIHVDSMNCIDHVEPFITPFEQRCACVCSKQVDDDKRKQFDQASARSMDDGHSNAEP